MLKIINANLSPKLIKANVYCPVGKSDKQVVDNHGKLRCVYSVLP